MALLQDPKIQNIYDKCKYQVKLWEHNFKKKSGRLPSKLDIHEAAKDVRTAYKIYFRLKTAALEESLMDIDGFDADLEIGSLCTENKTDQIEEKLEVESETKTNISDTWGIHLNKQTDVQDKIKEKSEKLNVNLSFTQKLFNNSKSSKCTLRKSLSFNRKKSETDVNKPGHSSQPNQLEIPDNILKIDDVKTVTSVPNIRTQPVNLVLNATVNNDFNSRSERTLDFNWVKRATHNAEIVISNIVSNPEHESDDIVDNSEDETYSCNLYHVTKKVKIANNFVPESNDCKQNDNLDLVAVETNTRRLDFSNIFTNKNESSGEINDSINVKSGSNSKLQNNETPKSKQVRKSKRKTKPIIDLSCKLDLENQDPYCTDEDPYNTDEDIEFKLDNSCNNELNSSSDLENKNEDFSIQSNKNPKKTSKENKKQTKRRRRQKPSKKAIDIETEEYELEYSIKPRIINTPRITNLKQVIKKIKRHKPVEDSNNDRENVSNQRLKKKIKSGTLNENYVQINLKKKIYVRGKNTMTFSKFKKQQWRKNKNKNSGCDSGMFTCFNCGQVGHFAKACKLSKSDYLLPLEKDEKACPYPTLEEAAKMAKESVLAVRVPSQIQMNESTEQKDVDECFDDGNDNQLLAETERLEQEIAKIDVRMFIDITNRVKPYYSLTENGSIIDTPQEVFDVLQKFGHEKFRTGQEQAIMRILSGKSTLVTLSTGSGKSLCYQLPAYLYSQREACISLIISPLVSLMEDQVMSIPGFLKAACLHTNQTKSQKEKIIETINEGNLDILLVSPEAVVAGERSSGFGSILRKLPSIAFACIDEAHCVSQWSHNFRPSYLKICHVLRNRLGINTILGLTATATRTTSDSIIEHLCIPDGREGIITDVPLPDNLKLTISRDVQRDQALLCLLLSERFVNCKSIIVYCTRREECQRVATFLRTTLKYENCTDEKSKKRKRYSLVAEPYHAGMTASRRKTIQKAFMSGELRIVVATVAFGMGINKSDIRAVIHYNMPSSFESYVQEVGRAGRDGLPAHCHLFLDSQGKDESELQRHVYANSTDRHVVRKLLQRCFIPCSCKGSCPRHEVAFSIQETVQVLDIPEENIETLLCYLELHGKHQIELLSHAYVTCKIISYSGPQQILKAAKECPPLAMALVLYQNKMDVNSNIVEFPVVEVASAMGWDSGICKHKLKNLEWITENNQPKRSKLNVQFLNLGFRLLAPGNLSDTELDEALDTLNKLIQEQERTSLLQLQAVHTTLISVAQPTFKLCIANEQFNENEQILKKKLREYFENPTPLILLPKLKLKPVNEEQIIADTCALICTYQDCTFTGRAVARIFHGIQSPNYPVFMWKRCKFWRAHLGFDFNAISKIAAKEIVRLK